jgi:TP901 family phage tail tape measure protein
MAVQSKLELILELKNQLNAGFGKAKQFVNSEMATLKSKINDFSTSTANAFTAVKDQVPGLSNVLGMLSNPYALATAAALAFVGIGTKSVGMALDWEKGLAKVNVTARLNRDELDKLSKKLLWLGANGTTDIETIPEAFNTIISAVGDVNKSMEILVPTLKASKAGFTDIKTVADAATGVMASSGENITKTYDVMFETLNRGKVEFKDIAAYLPKIIPNAKNAGFALEEIGGAFAYLTAKGLSAEQTAVGLQNTFKAFTDPRVIGNAKEGFKSIGLDIFDAHRNTKPFLQLMKELSTILGKSKNNEQFIKTFSKIGLDKDAVAAVSLMTQDFAKLEEIVKGVANSQGALDQAVKDSAVSTEGWSRAWNKVKFLGIEFGQTLLPVLNFLGDVVDGLLGGLIKLMLDLSGGIQGVWDMMKELWKIIVPLGEAFANFYNPAKFSAAIEKVADSISKADFSGAFKHGYQSVIDEYQGKLPGSLNPTNDKQKALDLSAVTGGNVPEAEVKGATPNKSITINLEALHKGDNILKAQGSNEGDGMSLDELEKKMNEIFLRLLRNANAAF